MSSVRERIIEALVNKVKTGAQGVRVHRSRVTASTRTELPAVLIEAASDSPDASSALGSITWTMVVRLSILTASDIPDLAADPIIVQVHQALISDKSLNGLTMDIEPGDVRFELYNGDGPRGVVSLSYLIQYRTLDADLSQQG